MKGKNGRGGEREDRQGGNRGEKDRAGRMKNRKKLSEKRKL